MKNICQPIHLWNLRLSAIRDNYSRCKEVLNSDEQQRAERFVKAADRERFILCRGGLRSILAQALHLEPTAIEFRHNPNGKPYLSESDLQFNISHSADRLLVAIGRNRALGVDVEFRRAGVPMHAIARRWFSAEERAALRNANDAQTCFFDLWTRKEAYVKALGDGIFHELSSFTVPIGTARRREPIQQWHFQPLPIDPHYSATLVWQTQAFDTDSPEVSIHENLLWHGRAQ